MQNDVTGLLAELSAVVLPVMLVAGIGFLGPVRPAVRQRVPD
jgi:hypothetical protein